MFLKKIIEMKKEEIQRSKTKSCLKEFEDIISSLPPPRDFMGAISLKKL